MLVTIETNNCLVCGKEGTVEVQAAQYFLWRSGAFVQDAFPDLPAALREQLLTGTHPACWDKVMGEYDEGLEEEQQGIVIRDREA